MFEEKHVCLRSVHHKKNRVWLDVVPSEKVALKASKWNGLDKK